MTLTVFKILIKSHKGHLTLLPLPKLFPASWNVSFRNPKLNPTTLDNIPTLTKFTTFSICKVPTILRIVT